MIIYTYHLHRSNVPNAFNWHVVVVHDVMYNNYGPVSYRTRVLIIIIVFWTLSQSIVCFNKPTVRHTTLIRPKLEIKEPAEINKPDVTVNWSIWLLRPLPYVCRKLCTKLKLLSRIKPASSLSISSRYNVIIYPMCILYTCLYVRESLLWFTERLDLYVSSYYCTLNAP